MRKPLSIFFFLLVLVLFFIYGLKGEKKYACYITMIGSTSVMPFAEILADHFKEKNPSYSIDVQGGGSTAGIQAVFEGTATIGMSSRKLKEEEKGLKEFVICYDAIAIIVHPENPLKDVSLKDLRDIFAGRKRNWRDFGWIDRSMDVIVREEGSGTRGAFEELIMEGEEIAPSVMVQDSNGAVKEVVAKDPYAIGFISLGLLEKRVKALSIEGVEPNLDNVIKRRYRFVRPFLFLTKKEDMGCEKEFIDFVLSKEGQEILQKEGLIPVR